MSERPTPEAVLNCSMIESLTPPHGLPYNAPTVGIFLTSMLGHLWKERHLFDGKRPYGVSQWEYDVYAALGKGGLVECSFDEEGFIEEVDSALADELVAGAIVSLTPKAK